jgi:hypothetical protein
VLGRGKGTAVLAELFDGDVLYEGGEEAALSLPTFLGNHDMGRAARMIKDRSGGKSGAELLRRVQLAHSLMYLLRGAPVVYYGDEVGIIGRGGDKEARQDLFPTQVAGWRTEERVGSPPIGTRSSLELASHPVAGHLKQLAFLRDQHPALSTGASIVRHAAGGVLAVSRIDAADRREYVVVFNATTAPATVRLRTSTPSARWGAMLGASEGETSDAAGELVLHVPALSAEAFFAERPLPVSKPDRPVLRVAADDLTELSRVSVPAQAQPLSVAFAARRARGGWRRLAVDDSPPYRAFLDPALYRRGESVSLVAIARALDGTTATSAVVTTTVRR